jgi:DNA-binding NarL/FixJ family response regulator
MIRTKYRAMAGGDEMIGAVSDRPMSPAMSAQPVLAAQSERRAATAPPRGRVLIVEDEYFLALENEAALHAAGYEAVETAATGVDAVLLAREKRPDIVLNPSGRARDGIDAAIEISDRLGIAIIFATALSDRETRERAGRAFALGWLSKPYSSDDSSDEMLAAVSRAMQLLRGRRS